MTAIDDPAAEVIDKLRAHQAELTSRGIRHLALFGSVARGNATGESDVDLAVALDPAAEIGLLQLGALERRIAEILRRPVDLVPEPVEKQRLQMAIDRDRRDAF